MKWYWYPICIIFIVTGLFSIFKLSGIWSETSSVYGTLTTLETKADYSVEYKHDYGGVIEFETENYVTYTNEILDEAMSFDGTQGSYTILFNDILATNVKVYAGSISGDIVLHFYSTTGELVSTLNMNVVITFTAASTRVALVVENEDSSISYLNAYMQIYGSILKVVERG